MTGYSEQNFEEHIEKYLNGVGYESINHSDYDREKCLIPSEYIKFIKSSQPKQYERLQRIYGSNTDDKLISRVSDELSGRGVIDVLKNGIEDLGVKLNTLYWTPNSSLNPEHKRLYGLNRFSVVRQLRYSKKNENSIDVVLFLNGIPLVSMELKNQLTGQTVRNAEKQYRYDRDPNEPLLRFKRMVVHFAVDNDRVSMTTRLSGGKTRFFPYNRGIVNPINPNGLKTSYLWEEILTPESLLDILENFAVVIEESSKRYDPKNGKVKEQKSKVLIFPRYHQLDVVRKIRTSLKSEGVGHNYLIQHTTGAGKSYTIGWLSMLLTSLYKGDGDTKRMFDTVIVVTDRRVLDKQLQNTLKQLESTVGVVNPVDENSTQLKQYLEEGKSIIITTIQKFPFISGQISELKTKTFAVVIDEVHSSQSGETAKHIKISVSKGIEIGDEEEEFMEMDDIDSLVYQDAKNRKRQKHISYFGFSGTPKEKTLELFGRKTESGEFIPFHTYTMKQSIVEGFTLDVLKNYSTYKQWFTLKKKIEEDKELPSKKVSLALVKFANEQPETIRQKVSIILEHFSEVTQKKIQGQGCAMVVVRSRLHCVRYKIEMDKQLENYPFKCLVAFSGKVYDKHTHKEFTEESLNNLKQTSIQDAMKDPQYRLLIVANKFQTGYDEPLLHTMFVDRKLGGLQCVQTLSRLNRTMSGKDDTFVLDFVNEPDDIYTSFQKYYQTTRLTEETDPNRLYTLKTNLRNYHIYTDSDVDNVIRIFYNKNAPNEGIMTHLDRVVENWNKLEDDEKREGFRSDTQSFLRLYSFISQIADFVDKGLEKLYIFLRYLNRKLPKRNETSVLDVEGLVDLDQFHLQKNFEGSIHLQDTDGEFTPMSSDGGKKEEVEEELDKLSEIINRINDVYGGEFTDQEKEDIVNIRDKMRSNPTLKEVMMNGNNSDSNKKKVFDQTYDKTSLGYVNEKVEFYKKLNQKDIRSIITDYLFHDFMDYLNSNQTRPL